MGEAAKVGVVGLRDAGKTVMHVTLYGRPSPLDRPGVTLAFPPDSQKILEDLWLIHERGEKLPPTALANHRIVWELEEPVEKVEWTLDTTDAGGEFYSSLREEDVEAQAGPVDEFLKKCDAILYLIDASDERLLTSQIGALRKVLTLNKRQVRTASGMKARPICLVFTKADTFIPWFHEGWFELTDQVFTTLRNTGLPEPILVKLGCLENKELSREDFIKEIEKVFDTNERKQFQEIILNHAFHQLDINKARTALKRYLATSDSGVQLNAFLAGQASGDGDLYATFLISCIHHTCTGIRVSPKWIHEPIFWAIERIAAARTQQRQQRSKTRRKVAIGMLTLFALCAASAWGYGFSEANKEISSLQEWVNNHPGPEDSKSREEIRQQHLTQKWVRFPFVSNGYLVRQRKAIAEDKAAYHRFLFDGVVAHTEEMQRVQGDQSLKAQVQFIEGSSDYNGPLENEYVKFRGEKQNKYLEYEFGLLKARADKMSNSWLRLLGFKMMSDSFLMQIPEWKPKVAALLAEKMKARLDGEISRLNNLTTLIVNKTDQDATDAEYVELLEDQRQTFLNREPIYADKVVALTTRTINRLELYRYNKLQGQLAALQGSTRAKQRLLAIAQMPYVQWNEEHKTKVEEQKREAIKTGGTYWYNELCTKIIKLEGMTKAGDRRILIETTKWDLPDGLPDEWKSDLSLPTEWKLVIDNHLKDAKKEEEHYEVKVRLFPDLDKLTRPDEARNVVQRLENSRFRNGTYRSEFRTRLEESMLLLIVHLKETKTDDLPVWCRAFSEKFGDSKLPDDVKELHDDLEWKLAVTSESDTTLTYSARSQLYKDYMKIGYATRKVSAAKAATRLDDTDKDKTAYDLLCKSIPPKTWYEFENAKNLASSYLQGNRSIRTKKKEVEVLLKELDSYSTGVRIEMTIDQVNLSDAAGLNPGQRPSVTVYFARGLPEFKQISDLREYSSFHLDITDERLKSEYVYYRIYSEADKREYGLALNVAGKGSYSGWHSWRWKCDFGDDFLTANDGKKVLKEKLFFQNGTKTVDAEVVIRWKGSTLCDLKLSKYKE